MATKICPKCGSSNISYQREQISAKENGKHVTGSGFEIKKGLFYWAFIGWWIWIFKAIFNVGIFGLFSHRKGISSKTISKSTIKNCTMAVCQSCGYSWKA